MEFLKPSRGLSWSPVELGLAVLGCVQPPEVCTRSYIRLEELEGCTGPARSLHGARCSRSPLVPGAWQSLACALGPAWEAVRTGRLYSSVSVRIGRWFSREVILTGRRYSRQSVLAGRRYSRQSTRWEAILTGGWQAQGACVTAHCIISVR